MIANQLPLSEGANFALINRRLSVLLGPTYWPLLRTSGIVPEQREQFLSTLIRDLPSWFFCHSCSHLHLRDRVAQPGPYHRLSDPLECYEAIRQGGIRPYFQMHEALIDYELYFHHLQLAILRHHLGPSYGISTKDLSFIQVNEFGGSEPAARRTKLVSVEARICAEPARLCLRLQSWAILYTRDPVLALQRAKCIYLCDHLEISQGEMCMLIKLSLDAYRTTSEKQQDPKLHFCRRCKFGFQVEVLDMASDGLAIASQSG